MRRLTTTSYAVLCLLNVRDWSAYELAQQMTRSLGYVWPRAVSAIYEEPKVLVAHGLATASSEPTGRRPRTVYSITRAGKAALTEWLAQASAPPQFESEAVLRASFPEATDVETTVATLSALADDAQRLLEQVHAQTSGYLAPDHGPFPARLHVIALDARFVGEYAAMLKRWATWAVREVEGWPSTTPDDPSFALDSIAESERRARRALRE
jgi:PadR family transcriptional regulator AphA